MNKERRKAIQDVIDNLTKAKEAYESAFAELQEAISTARDDFENIKSEEEDYKENMPESLQNGEKGDMAQSAIDALESAMDTLDNIGLDELDLDEIDTAISSAEEAKGG